VTWLIAMRSDEVPGPTNRRTRRRPWPRRVVRTPGPGRESSWPPLPVPGRL